MTTSLLPGVFFVLISNRETELGHETITVCSKLVPYTETVPLGNTMVQQALASFQPPAPAHLQMVKPLNTEPMTTP